MKYPSGVTMNISYVIFACSILFRSTFVVLNFLCVALLFDQLVIWMLKGLTYIQTAGQSFSASSHSLNVTTSIYV